jgi:hypothetical protein
MERRDVVEVMIRRKETDDRAWIQSLESGQRINQGRARAPVRGLLHDLPRCRVGQLVAVVRAVLGVDDVQCAFRCH